MNPVDLVFVAMKKRVTALDKYNGNILWTEVLPGGIGDDFVTLTCDDTRLFAATKGQVHALDITTGKLLWSNELKGHGYGVASICLYGFPPAPDPGAYERILAAKKASQQSNAGTT